MIRQRGFTLIELLVVIVILGFLAAVVVFAVNGGDTTNYNTRHHCDGPNMVYTDHSGTVKAVASNDPRCRDGEN